MVEHQSRKEQILLVAYEIAGRSGVEEVHARTIAAELKINHAAVHYYFKRRSDLLAALIDYTRKRYVLDLARVRDPQPTAGKKLEAHIALFEAYCKPQSRLFKVITTLYSAALGDDSLRKPLEEFVSESRKRLTEDLQAAKESEELLLGTEYAHADTLHALLLGLCVRYQLVGGGDPIKIFDRLLNGLLRK